MKNTLLSTIVVIGIALGAAPLGFSITVDEVIALAQSGSQDGLIMSKIDADETVFQLTVEEILDLQEAGVSNTIITYMINSGKQFSEEDEALENDDAYDYGDYKDEVEYDDDDAYDATSGSWAAGIDYSNLGFGVTVGYYYPSWPGYYYSAYYDPFYWPGWGSYYSYCSPYPYWRWYSRSYACYSYSWHYWNRCSTPYPYYGKHHGHGYVHDNYYKAERYESDGRHSGSRGSVNRTRRGDTRNTPDPVMANNRIISPRRPGVRVVKDDDQSTTRRGYTLKRPRVEVKKDTPNDNTSSKRVSRKSVNVTPPRVKVKRDQPATEVKKPSTRSSGQRRQPAPTRKQVKVKPAKDSKEKEAPKKRVTPKPSPQTPKASQAPSKNTSPPKATRTPSKRRGGGGGRP